jgi:hypothetical protein
MLDTLQELEELRTWNEALTGPVELVLRATSDPRTGPLESFALAFSRVADRVRFTRLRGPSDSAPAFEIGSGWHYHGAPRGRELSPFLKILANGAPGAPLLTKSVQEFLRRVERPATLQVCVMPDCVHCPFVVSALAPLPFFNSRLTIELFDLSLFPEIAEQKGIKSVPVVLFGNAVRWTGPLQIQEVLRVLARAGDADPDAELMARMLREGSAEQLVSMVLERNRLFSDFPEVVTHFEWSVRLGAMVVLETVAEVNPELARSVLAPLWEHKTALDHTQLGDLLYLTGELGDGGWIETLDGFLREATDPELLEAGREALAKLAS